MTALIHFVDLARVGNELRPVCSAWSDDVTWTTIASLVTCSACARLARGGVSRARQHVVGARAARGEDGSSARSSTRRQSR